MPVRPRRSRLRPWRATPCLRGHPLKEYRDLRDSFRLELNRVDDQMVEMAQLVGTAVSTAGCALLTSDLQLAERTIAADSRIDDLEEELEDKVIHMMAQQAPVATDLRVLVATLRMVSTLERMGDLARHVAKLARLRFPHCAVPEQMKPIFEQMAKIDESLVDKAGRMLRHRDLALAAAILDEDDDIDALHKQVFAVLRDPAWSHGVETAVDVALCSRYFERLGDHAVSLAHRMQFLVTGEAPDRHGVRL